MRLVSYNILEGFRPVPHADGERRQIDRERAADTRLVVEQLAPDFLVLNEALFCRLYAGRTNDYGELFGFEHQAAALYDNEWGNVILSRHPIVHSEEMRIYNRGGLIAVVESPEGRLTVASYHPHPRRYPAHKASDFSELVTGLTGPLIVCGDFNCISPEDDIDYGELVAAFARFSTDPDVTLNRFIESGKLVFRALAEHGLHDAIPVQGRRYTMPTDLINSDKSSAIRIDHVLVNEGIDVAAGEVVHSELTNRASDHHPIVLDFGIGRRART